MPGETDRAVGQPRNRALKSSHVKKLKKIYTAVGPTCVRICPEKGCPELDVLLFSLGVKCLFQAPCKGVDQLS